MKKYIFPLLAVLCCLPALCFGQTTDIPAGGVTWKLNTSKGAWRPIDETNTEAYRLMVRTTSTYALAADGSEYTQDNTNGAYVTASPSGLTGAAATTPSFYKWLLSPVFDANAQQVSAWIVKFGSAQSTLTANATDTTLTLLQKLNEASSNAIVIRVRNSANQAQLVSLRLTGSDGSFSTNAFMTLKDSTGSAITLGAGQSNLNNKRFLITSVVSKGTGGNLMVNITCSQIDSSNNVYPSSTVTTGDTTVSNTTSWVWAGRAGFSGSGPGGTGTGANYIEQFQVLQYAWGGPGFSTAAASSSGLVFDGYNKVNVFRGPPEAARLTVLSLNRTAATNGNISLSASGVPTGITVAFDAPGGGGVYPYVTTSPSALQTQQNAYATISISASSAAALGTSNITITATDAVSGIAKTVTLTVGVYDPPSVSATSDTIKVVTWGDSHTYFTLEGDGSVAYQLGTSNANPDLDTVKRLADRLARLVCGDSYTLVSNVAGVRTYTGNGKTLIIAGGGLSGSNHLNWEHGAPQYVALHGLLNYIVANQVQFVIARVPLQNDSASLGLLGQLTNATSGGVATNGAASGVAASGILSSIRAILSVHANIVADPIFSKNYNNDGAANPLTSTADVANAANVASYNPHLKVWGSPTKSVSVTTTSGSITATVDDAIGLWPGQVITASGIPTNTTIADITSPGIVYTACQVSGTSSTITLPSGIAGTLSTGMRVYCTAFPGGTTVSSINTGANTVTVSSNAIPANVQTGFSTTTGLQNPNGDGFTGVIFVGPGTITLSAPATASATVTASVATQVTSTTGEEFRFYDSGLDKFIFAQYPGITLTGSQATINQSLEFTHLNAAGYKLAGYSMASNLIHFMLTKAGATASVNSLNLVNGNSGTLTVGATNASYWTLTSWPSAYLDVTQGSFSEVSDPGNIISLSGSGNRTVNTSGTGTATVSATITRSALAVLNTASSSTWPTNSGYTGTWSINAANGTVTVTASGTVATPQRINRLTGRGAGRHRGRN